MGDGPQPDRYNSGSTGLPVATPETDATRPAEPEIDEATAVFLSSDEVGPMTGATFVHDGGITSF